MMEGICEDCGTIIRRSHCTEDYLVFECQNLERCCHEIQCFEDNTDQDWEWIIKYYRKGLSDED